MKLDYLNNMDALVRTNPSISPESRDQILTAIDGLRLESDPETGDTPPPPAPELDRRGLEQLRKSMGRKKGKAPVRAK